MLQHSYYTSRRELQRAGRHWRRAALTIGRRRSARRICRFYPRACGRGLNPLEKGKLCPDQLAQQSRPLIRPEASTPAERPFTRHAAAAAVACRGLLLGAPVPSARPGLVGARLRTFVFAAHLNGDPELLRGVVLARRANTKRQEVIVAVRVVVADAGRGRRARRRRSEVWGGWSWQTGGASPWPAKNRPHALARQAGSEPVRIASPGAVAAGQANSLRRSREQLNALHQQWGLTDLIIRHAGGG